MADEQPKPGDPGQGEAPAETQDKPKTWWEARGFKSEEEALAAWEDSQKRATEQAQRLAAAERTIQAIVTAQPRTEGAPSSAPKEPGYRRYFQGNALEEAYASGDASRFAETLMSGIERAIQEGAVRVISHQEELRAIRDAFYEENKDLKPYPELVKLFSSEVGAENPNMTVKDAMAEVAKRVRAKVAAIKRGDAPPAGEGAGAPPKPKEALPHSGPGGDGAPAGAPPAPKKEDALSEAEAEVKRRLALKEKKTILR